jgi:hypothetical protein
MIGHRRSSSGRTLERSLVSALVALALLPARLCAQEPPAEAESGHDSLRAAWFPRSFLVAPLRAAPREVKLRGGFISADRDLDNAYAGRNVEAQVYLGLRLPVIRFQDEAPGRPGLDLGFEVGNYSRFAMEEFEKDLIIAGYRVGFPFSLRYRWLDFRAVVAHESSHYGDDYVKRFEPEFLQISRELLELLVAWRPVAGGRLYVGGDYNFGRGLTFLETGDLLDPFEEVRTVGEWRARFGLEYDPTWEGRRRPGPFVAANFETTDRTDRLSVNAVAGVALWLGPVRFLFDAEYHDGPSSMGQFELIDESFWGLNLTIELWAGAGG